MNKNYKEQYLKVKDIKDEQCDCISEDFLCQLASYVSNKGYDLRIANNNDTFVSSQTHLDTNKVLVYRDGSEYRQIRFRCGEQVVTKTTPSSITIHCGELGEIYNGVRKQIGTLQGMDRFIEILADVDL
jgi:hypothetical protein